MSSTWIIKIGSTLPELSRERGDYEDWIAASLGMDQVDVCDLVAGAPLPRPDDAQAIIITGSSALVTDALPWSVGLGQWLSGVLAARTPLLGICYGHQLMAQSLGGKAGTNPKGREIGMADLCLTAEGQADPLLGVLPKRFKMSCSHRQVALTLPATARRLAYNAMDENQAFAIGDRAWGVQFHPEWDHEVIGAYLRDRRDILSEEGLDPDALLANVSPNDWGERLLKRFAELAQAP